MDQNHEAVAELLGAYALDAVDGEELDMVERHLVGCPKCAAELVDHREVAAMMAYTGAAAPEGLWSRIVESLEEAPPALNLSLLDGRSAELTAADPEPVDELAARRGQRRRFTPAIGAVAAAALVVGLISGAFITRNDATSLGGETASAVSLEAVARDALNDPEARRITLASVDDGALATTAAVRADGSGYLLGTSLPALDESQTYQLWAVRDDAIISLGVLGHTPGVAAFRVAEGTKALAITAEQAGGVTSSSNAALLVGNLD